MTDLQIYLTVGVFAGVILVIAFDLIDMAVAALAGVCLLLAMGLLDGEDLMAAAVTAGGPLALLFGGMVVARVLARTGVFEWVGRRFLRATGGSGRRYLLLLVALVAPICAFLPNATTVILVAPVIIAVARALKVDFVGPMVLTAVVSNSAGMLTLVALLILAGIGVLSSLLANIPVVAAALIMTKGYLVAAEAVPEVALAAGFTDWPAATIPVFIAMMFGATLGAMPPWSGPRPTSLPWASAATKGSGSPSYASPATVCPSPWCSWCWGPSTFLA